MREIFFYCINQIFCLLSFQRERREECKLPLLVTQNNFEVKGTPQQFRKLDYFIICPDQSSRMQKKRMTFATAMLPLSKQL